MQARVGYGSVPMRRRATGQFTFLVLCFFPAVSWAAGGGHGPAPHVWLGLAFILAMAKLGGELALRLKQPPVLGELVAGIILGNLGLVGVGGMHALAADPSIMFLAELGVILLLFEVGLESTVSEMKRVAPQSGLVAVIGVIAPMGAGFLVSWLMLSDQPHTLHLFVGATLCATSVGITARVLQDLNFMQRKESQIILGAAVIDDVLGLIILAVVSAIAVQGQMPPALELFKIIGLAIGFLIGALVIGMLVTPGVFRAASKLRAGGVLAALAIAFCLALSGLAAWAGLAAIVGAFAAGLVLDEVHVRPFGHHSAHDLSKLVAPIVAVLAPVFFVRTGMGVDLSIVGPDALLFAAALSRRCRVHQAHRRPRHPGRGCWEGKGGRHGKGRPPHGGHRHDPPAARLASSSPPWAPASSSTATPSSSQTPTRPSSSWS